MRIEFVGFAPLGRSGRSSLLRPISAFVGAAGVIACLALAGEAAAQDAEDTDVKTPEPVASGIGSSGEKICRYEDVTGSRMRKRVCQTAEQWEARERASKSLARELDGRAVRGQSDGP